MDADNGMNDRLVDHMVAVLTEYMKAGLLENVIDMFRHDRGLFAHLCALVSNENDRVRLGAVALVENLRDDCGGELVAAIPLLAEVLGDPNPTIRADAVYVLEIIRHKDALPFLEEIIEDKHPAVREAVKEAIEEINRE